MHGSQIHITLRGTGYNFQSEITFVMIAVLLVAENTSELVLIIIHLSGFFFFFTMVCAIFSLLRRIFDSCHSRVILSIFSLCLQVFYLVSFVSTKRMHRGTYIFKSFPVCIQSCIVIYADGDFCLYIFNSYVPPCHVPT